MRAALVGTFAVVLGWAAVRACGGDKPDEAGRALAELQGTWQLVSYEWGGKKYEDEPDTVVTFSGDNLLVHHPTTRRLTWYRVKVDPGATPRCIDATVVYTNEPFRETDEGRTREGVYELKGDTLRICFNRPGLEVKERPQKFLTRREGPEVLLYVLKRTEGKADGRPSPPREEKAKGGGPTPAPEV